MEANKVLCQWARLGIMFNLQPAAQTPDIENAAGQYRRGTSANAASAACMCNVAHNYGRLGCRHRLAALSAGHCR
jgi:hypothetical protein